MGRQLQIMMNRADERALLEFLRASAPIQLFESFAPTPAALAVDDFADVLPDHHTYRIWNRNFPWTLDHGTVGSGAANPDHVGWSYLRNTGTGPLLEVTRSDIAQHRAGRLYWAANFSAPAGLAYDAEAFGRWVDSIWRWCRRHGEKKRSGGPDAPYILPGARAELVRA